MEDHEAKTSYLIWTAIIQITISGLHRSGMLEPKRWH